MTEQANAASLEVDEDAGSSAEWALLAAEDTLRKLSQELAEDFQEHGNAWPREWMAKHVKSRQAIIDARNVILDVIGRQQG